MIREAEAMVVNLKENLSGGQGTIRVKAVFKQEDLTGKARIIAEVIVPVGGSIGFHRHEQEEEIFYIISGTGTADDNGSERQVKAGDAILTPGGTGHGIVNTGAQPLVIMAVVLTYV